MFFSLSSIRPQRTVRKRCPQPLLARPSVETLEDRIALNGDMVITWNNFALDAFRVDRTSPPRSSRALAILHTAVYDAVNAINRTHESYLVETVAPANTSAKAAVASAAHTVLVALFPAQKTTFDAGLAGSLAGITDGPSEDNGVALGKRVANQILTIRSTDKSTPAEAQTAWPDGDEPGEWKRTPAAFAAALLPGWGDVTPFAMTSGDQFRVNPPDGVLGIPDLTSAEYTAAFNEVRLIGRADAESNDRDGNGQPDRTAEQTAIALFWANGAGTSTPPGHLNVLAQLISEAKGLSLAKNARLFAMLNVAQADAAIMSWDFKYEENFWRPVTAIREAGVGGASDADGNPDTIADTAWTSLIGTPPFPAYTSGHSSFSAAAAAVLESFFGARPGKSVTFTLPSEDPNAADRTFTSSVIDGVKRTSYFTAAYESAMSRLYGGIHWSFDNFDGLTTGTALGEFVADNFFQAKPLRADAEIVDGKLLIVGTDKSDVFRVDLTAASLIVRANGTVLGEFDVNLVTSIVVEARGGDDSVTIASQVTISTEVHGGKGNDTLRGGGGFDRLLGEEGNDRLFGQDEDVLTGGPGFDVLSRGNRPLFIRQ